MTYDHNEQYRFGSAGFADEEQLRRAGFFEQTDHSFFFGFQGRKRLLWNGAGGMAIVAGARSGKLRDCLGYAISSAFYKNSLLVLDLKGELAAIFAMLEGHAQATALWNPLGLHGLPQHRINPVEYICSSNPSLVSDTKVFCQNILPKTGGNNSEYFESRGQSFLEAIILTIVKLDGALTLKRLYEIINLIPGGGEEWINFAWEMHNAGYPIAKSVEEEIATSRGSSSNGFQGILGEVMKAVAPLSDPVLMASVSAPFTASMADMCGDTPMHFYLMPPAEFIESWAMVIKAFFVAGMIYKSRAPGSPPQTWVLDECAQLGAFPLVTRMFTYGAGIGIRPVAVYQSLHQMKLTGPDADNIIPASSAVQLYFGVREYDTASRLSNMLGTQTLYYDDEMQQLNAEAARQRAIQSLLGGDDPFAAGMELAHQKKATQHRAKQGRRLRTPDEILNMPPDKAIAFADGIDGPIDVDRGPYYEQRFMAGRYLGNPYHPSETVRIKTRFGRKNLRPVRSRVAPQYAHYPQFADGFAMRLEA